METCLTCGREVEVVHPVPPEDVTRGLFEQVPDIESPADIETCIRCLDELMQSGSLP